jgi:hypothetical protein
LVRAREHGDGRLDAGANVLLDDATCDGNLVDVVIDLDELDGQAAAATRSQLARLVVDCR